MGTPVLIKFHHLETNKCYSALCPPPLPFLQSSDKRWRRKKWEENSYREKEKNNYNLLPSLHVFNIVVVPSLIPSSTSSAAHCKREIFRCIINAVKYFSFEAKPRISTHFVLFKTRENLFKIQLDVKWCENYVCITRALKSCINLH